MTKEEKQLAEIQQLSRKNERYEILNDLLRYLIKKNVLNPIMSYEEIEEIIKNRDKIEEIITPKIYE